LNLTDIVFGKIDYFNQPIKYPIKPDEPTKVKIKNILFIQPHFASYQPRILVGNFREVGRIEYVEKV
jgi:hypothetical protein